MITQIYFNFILLLLWLYGIIHFIERYYYLSIWHIVYDLFSWLLFHPLTPFDLYFTILFHKTFQKFFSIKVFCYTRQKNSISNYFNCKNFFRPIWSVKFCKNVFIFLYSYIITNFKFRLLFIIFYNKVNIRAWIYIKKLHFNVSITYIVLFINDII